MKSERVKYQVLFQGSTEQIYSFLYKKFRTMIINYYTANPEWFIYSRKIFSIESGLFLKNKCLNGNMNLRCEICTDGPARKAHTHCVSD
jgi:hypothetical protein